MDETEIHGCVNLPQQMILWYQVFQQYDFVFVLTAPASLSQHFRRLRSLAFLLSTLFLLFPVNANLQPVGLEVC